MELITHTVQINEDVKPTHKGKIVTLHQKVRK